MLSKISNYALEAILGVLLAVAGITISWSGYQAALWSGIQDTNYNRATIINQESVRVSEEANQLQLVDIAIFLQWLNVYGRQDIELEQFYRSRFRPEFAIAFNAWIDSDPLINSDANPTPFSQSEYKIAKRDVSSKLNEEGKKLFEEGREANKVSDLYTRSTVVLGMVMFLIGIGQQFNTHDVRVFIMAISLIILAIGLAGLVTYPVAHPGG